MRCLEQSIRMLSGESKDLILSFKKDEDGLPLNLDTDLAAGVNAIELQVKKNAGDPDPALISLDLSVGIIKRAQVGDDIGIADVTIPSSATTTAAEWPVAPGNVGRFYYDVKIILASGKVKYAVPPNELWVVAVVNGV